MTATELSYGDSNNVVITKPAARTVIHTYMDKETASIFQIDQNTIDNFPYYSIRRVNGTLIYLDPMRVRRIYEGYQISVDPDEEETAELAQPIKETQRAGRTQVVYHKDHAEIIWDKSRVVPPRTETQIDLAEANRKLKAYEIPKLQTSGKDLVGEISVLADKTERKRLNLANPKTKKRNWQHPSHKDLNSETKKGKGPRKEKKSSQKRQSLLRSLNQTKTRLWN